MNHLSVRIGALLFFVLIFDGVTSWNNGVGTTLWGPINGPMDQGVFRYPYAIAMALVMLAIVVTVWSFKRSPDFGVTSTEIHSAGRANSRLPDPLLTLRAFACLLVIIGHYFVAVFPAVNLHQLLEQAGLVQLLASPPWAGVWIFFTLSGYLMGKGFFSDRYTIDEAGLRHFFRNRALRIVPVYVVAVLVVCAVQYQPIFHKENLWMLLRILIFDYNADFPINPIGALWSISTEVQFYLVAPFLALAINSIDERFRLNSWWVPALFMLVGFGVRMGTLIIWSKFLYMPIAAQLDLFVGGMLLSKVVQSRGSRPTERGGWRLSVGVAGMIIFYIALTMAASRTILVGIGPAYFMAATASACGAFSLLTIGLFERANMISLRAKTSTAMYVVKKTQLAGILTYCIYIVHDPVYVTLRKSLPTDLILSDNLSRLFLVIPLVVAYGYALYSLVEKPFDRKRV